MMSQGLVLPTVARVTYLRTQPKRSCVTSSLCSNSNLLLQGGGMVRHSVKLMGPLVTRRRLGQQQRVAIAHAGMKKESSNIRQDEDQYVTFLQERDAQLQERERELWERQMDMTSRMLDDSSSLYETVKSAYESLQHQYQQERELWMKREEKLVTENEELRNKLLYSLARLAELQKHEGEIGRIRPLEEHQEDWIDGTAASGSIPTSVQRAQQKNAQTSKGKSSLADDFAAAFAAVEHGDILKDDPLAHIEQQQDSIQQQKEPNLGQQLSNEWHTQSKIEQQSHEDGHAEIPNGPPPVLSIGDDDIYWVNQLHVALVDEGYFPGDQDIDDFMFGEGTLSALQTFQACSGLPETGVADSSTWKMLLGEELETKQSRDLTEDMSGIQANAVAQNSSSNKKPFAELFEIDSFTLSSSASGSSRTQNRKIVQEEHVHDEKFFADGHVEITDVDSISTGSARTSWPILLEGDGGKDVHVLHVLLESAGYWPGEDDARWWQFGDTTVAALKTYQACNGVPESGVCDEPTWKSLLGPGSEPCDLDAIRSGKSDDEDLADDGGGTRVWLIGEQRWEDRSRLAD